MLEAAAYLSMGGPQAYDSAAPMEARQQLSASRCAFTSNTSMAPQLKQGENT